MVSFLALVIKGSTYLRNALAFATVVVMRLLRMSEEARFDSNALRWLAVLPK
jgi:hypothetical protein